MKLGKVDVVIVGIIGHVSDRFIKIWVILRLRRE